MGENVMTQPKVSVVIPIWNTEKYLEKCLSSVVNQTLKDIEIICVNNGSTDSSAQIIEKFAQNDLRIKIVNKEHGCLSSARNAGMAVATAPYMTFVDSDDWIEPECYELALAEFEKDSDIDMVCWGANIVNIDLDEKSTYLNNARSYHAIRTKGKQPLTENTILNSTVCVWNKLYKSKIITDNNVLFPTEIELEDNSFFYCYVANCQNAFYIDRYMYNYVQRKNSGLERIRSGRSPITAPMLKNLQFIINYYKKHNCLDQNSALIIRIAPYWIASDYRDAMPANKPKVFVMASEILTLLDNKLNNANPLLVNLKEHKYNMATAILEKKQAKLWGTSLLGLYTIPNLNRYIIKLLGIKFSFKYNKKGQK
ncbi:MAG: glycosyltransferase [Fusobacterium sp.]|nr:glycosyltransferase [Fusobacterium sp.]